MTGKLDQRPITLEIFMALVTCTECGNKVSEHADRCPHCRVPVSIRRIIGSSNFQTLINISTLIVLALIFMVLLYQGVYLPLHLKGQI